MTAELIGPLEIKSLAFGGNGVARFGGRVVFVRGAVPGDVVWGRVLVEKKRYAEAEAVRFDRLSEQRCEVRCPVFGQCGGCQWQMLPYAQQLLHKEKIFRDILTRQCQLDAGLISPLLESPVEWNYRSRVQFKCVRLADTQLAIGFYRPATHEVVDVESCAVISPVFNQLLARVRLLLQAVNSRIQIEQIDMEGGDGPGIRLVFHVHDDANQDLEQCLAPLSQEPDLSIYIKSDTKGWVSRFCGTGELSIEVDSPSVQLEYGVGGFTQINLAQNRRMIAEALDLAELKSDWRVLDLYCGMGNFSLPLARRVSEVVGVEEYGGSVEQGGKNAQRNGIDNLQFYADSAKNALGKYAGEKGFDLVFLDPPRSGAKEVIAELVQRKVPRVLYVSCDPMTLARDLKTLLAGSYRLVESRPLDMFPQTWHLESISFLVLD